MNNLYVSLKQHTDLIHFQSKDDQPALRMSELKPKLDRFIWSMLDKEEQEEWLKKKFARKHSERETQSLNYSVRVVSQGKCVGSKVGNRDQNYLLFQVEEMKKDRVNYSTVVLRFFSFHEEIIAKIKNRIDTFFLLHNFGYRQRKGFGSFTVAKLGETSDSQTYVKIIKNPFTSIPVSDLMPMWIGSIEMKRDKNNYLLFGGNAAVSILYMSLRSGINYIDRKEESNNRYLRSYLSRRLNQRFSSDKVAIKQALDAKGYKRKTTGGEKRQAFDNRREQRAIRISLGMGYEAAYQMIGPMVTLKYIYKDKLKNIVKRFPSPLMFKVIDHTIHVLLFAESYKTYMADSSVSVNIYKEGKRKLQQEEHLVKDLPVIAPDEVGLPDLLRQWLYDLNQEKNSKFNSELPHKYNTLLSNIKSIELSERRGK